MLRKNRIKRSEVKENRTDRLNILIVFLWLAGLFLRVYRQSDLLGFYYDQGRDALKILDVLSFKDLPAIGPTTGLAGIFLGPFWFYFIAPFYWLGKGDPAIAAAFIGFIDSLTVVLLYVLGKRFFNKKVGVFAAAIWAFSYGLIRSARWFSNPSPLPFFTVLFLLGFGEWLINKKDKWLPIVFICLAISIQLEAASAVFYFPAILLVLIFAKAKFGRLFKKKSFYLGISIFALSFLPQLVFEVKNNFLMTKNFFGFLVGSVNTEAGRSWMMPNFNIVVDRLKYYYSAFFSNIEINLEHTVFVAIPFLTWLLFRFFKKIKKKIFDFELLLDLFLTTPLVFLFFFVGNYGNLYGYYLVGFFPVFILLLAIFLDSFSSRKILAAAPLLFFIWFFWRNGIFLKGYLSAGVDGPEHITLGNQKKAIEWVCQKTINEKFNVDVYVPPVIPDAWDYLWKWYGCQQLNCCPQENREQALYTIYEVDPPHPERLEAWFARQAGIGKIVEEIKFGGVGVRRRIRLDYLEDAEL